MNLKFKHLKIERYETKALEKYLEDMASEGWILSYLNDYVLRFEKGEKRSLKYSIKRSGDKYLWTGTDNQKELKLVKDYRDSGWELVTSFREINIFATEDRLAIPPSDKTFKEEIIEDISESKKSILAKLLAYFILLIVVTIYSKKLNLFQDYDKVDTLLFAVVTLIIAILYNIFDLVSLLAFKRNFNKLIKDNSSMHSLLFLKSINRKINFLNALMLLFYILALTICIITFFYKIGYIIILGLAGLMKLFKVTYFELNYRIKTTGKKLNICLRIMLTLVIILGCTSLFADFFRPEPKDLKTKITLKDFNDTSLTKEYSWDKNSIISQGFHYYETGENHRLIYKFIEVKYDFLIDKYYEDTLDFYTEKRSKNHLPYSSKELEGLPSGVRGYVLSPTDTLILNIKNYIIEIPRLETISKEELIKVVYEKLK